MIEKKKFKIRYHVKQQYTTTSYTCKGSVVSALYIQWTTDVLNRK